ncbi:unnamed protein product [Diamesa serratosioi]
MFTEVYSSHSFHLKILSLVDDESAAIKSITIEDSQMDNLPAELFDAFKNLENLKASDLELERVQHYDFRNARKLITLNVSSNHITKLQDYMFDTLPKLETIDMSHNLISTIRRAAFHLTIGYDNVIQLKAFNLSHNRLSSIDMVKFDSLKNLEVLHLDHNHIETFEALTSPKYLQDNVILKNLKELYLQQNRLQQFDAKIVKNVQLINLNGNSLNSENFNIANLKELHINYNEFKGLEISDQLEVLHLCGNDHPIKINFNKNQAMKELRIVASEIDGDLIKEINNMKNLRSLELSYGNYIIDDNSFENLNMLENLTLSFSRLNKLPNIFKNKTNIINLNFKGNSFETIDMKDFSQLTNLKMLQLEACKLKTVNNYKDLKSTLPNLETIDLSGNYFHCHYLNDIIDEFNKQNISVPEDIHWFTYPSSVRGITCKNTTDEIRESFSSVIELNEAHEQKTKYKSILLIIFIVTLLLVCIYFAYRKFDLGNKIKQLSFSNGTERLHNDDTDTVQIM